MLLWSIPEQICSFHTCGIRRVEKMRVEKMACNRIFGIKMSRLQKKYPSRCLARGTCLFIFDARTLLKMWFQIDSENCIASIWIPTIRSIYLSRARTGMNVANYHICRGISTIRSIYLSHAWTWMNVAHYRKRRSVSFFPSNRWKGSWYHISSFRLLYSLSRCRLDCYQTFQQEHCSQQVLGRWWKDLVQPNTIKK